MVGDYNSRDAILSIREVLTGDFDVISELVNNHPAIHFISKTFRIGYSFGLYLGLVALKCWDEGLEEIG
jgi:hypothetical protein